MWEIFYGEEPYPGMSSVKVAFGVVNQGMRPDQPSKNTFAEMPDAYELLMERCWEQDHNKRPKFEHILKELEQIEDYGFQRRP